MEKFIVEGKAKLRGKVTISGAKNSSLALAPATILNSGVNVITNTPEVNDIYSMKKLLAQLGADVRFENQVLTIDSSGINSQIAPYDYVKKMRASVYVLGPLLAKYGYAKVSMPGGCAWGPRPINLHLEALKKLGADIKLEEGYIIAKAKKLKGTHINFDISSVGATGNIMMAAVLAEGETLISNAAIEPEIILLGEFLIKMGAEIEGLGTHTLRIVGVDNLEHAEIENISDRIEAGTILIAAAMTRSKIQIENCCLDYLDAIIEKLDDSGVKVNKNNNIISVDASNLEIKGIDISTSPYPGFPTDMQAQWTAYMSLCDSSAVVKDNIYFDRFKHVPELNRLGANIEIQNNSAIIKGVNSLTGAKVMSTDLRASASLVLAALAAEGTTEVLRIYHLDRGYQRIEEKFRDLGANIIRTKTDEF